MSSSLNRLRLVTICSYLTDTSNTWRGADHTASKMVKALKGDPINGYFDLTIKGSKRRFTQQNVAEFVAIIPEVLAQVILSKTEGSATLVPIPNSQVTHLDIAGFRTLYLARGISDHSRGRLTAIPALVFATPQTSARKGGTRNKTHIGGSLSDSSGRARAGRFGRRRMHHGQPLCRRSMEAGTAKLPSCSRLRDGTLNEGTAGEAARVARGGA
jgi:hypothetical protein